MLPDLWAAERITARFSTTARTSTIAQGNKTSAKAVVGH
jgi:hypothetical protein